MIETCRLVEDDVDAATSVDAKNAPTEVWKSRTEREIPTAPTSIILSLEKKRNEDPNNSDQLSTRSDQVQPRTGSKGLIDFLIQKRRPENRRNRGY